MIGGTQSSDARAEFRRHAHVTTYALGCGSARRTSGTTALANIIIIIIYHYYHYCYYFYYFPPFFRLLAPPSRQTRIPRSRRRRRPWLTLRRCPPTHPPPKIRALWLSSCIDGYGANEHVFHDRLDLVRRPSVRTLSLWILSSMSYYYY